MAGKGAPTASKENASKTTKGKETIKGKDAKKKEEEVSEEDQQLMEELKLLVERLQDPDTSLHLPALETMRTLIRTSTTSMTSVPKPLKFLRKHFDELVKIHQNMAQGRSKNFLSDIVSVLAMTVSTAGKRATLQYHLSGSDEPIGSWGHEYVRFLSAEVGQEYEERVAANPQADKSDLIKIANEIVPFVMAHNAEADACDLLMELEMIHEIVTYVDSANYQRVCLYLMSCVNYVPEPEDVQILKTVFDIYKKLQLQPEALIVALRLNDPELIKRVFDECPDGAEKKQLAYILARQQIHFETNDSELDDIINNTRLSEQFINLGRELEVLEPKTPEDVYKSHLETIRPSLAAFQVDSAKQNLSSTFVNAFLNAGFGKDKLLTEEGKDGNSWIFKHKDHGMMSATAALGMILLWDVEQGLSSIDKYLYLKDDYVKAGALLAVGIVNTTVRNECDPAQALLSEFVEDKKSAAVRLGAIAGLGLAYAGSNREDIMNLLLPIVADTTVALDIAGMASLAVGLIGVGQCSEDASSTLLQMLLEREPSKLNGSFARFIALGLGLLYLGRQQEAEATMEALKAVSDPMGKQASVVLEVCAYAGTGNVLKIQKMLSLCTDHLDPEKESDLHQAFAVLGIAVIAMGEEIGTEMSFRSFNHLMHYGEPVIRRTVPLALGLLCASNPQEVQVIDTLSKYSHDNDAEVSQAAIFAMGLVGAGTNNARLAQMLRQLASYYQRDANNLFLVRIAQGLLHMAKGTVSISPYHSNRLLMSPVSVAGLLSVLIAFTDIKNIILGNYHYMMYFLSISMYPRMLQTLDINGQALPVTVRVGQAVDVVGQAGRPKTITGFQTHTTPVLLGHGERAELATEEYIPVSKILEGLVILKKNPEYIKEEEKEKK